MKGKAVATRVSRIKIMKHPKPSLHDRIIETDLFFRRRPFIIAAMMVFLMLCLLGAAMEETSALERKSDRRPAGTQTQGSLDSPAGRLK